MAMPVAAAPHQGLRQRAEQLAAPIPPLLVAAERVAATVAQGVHGRRRVGTGETFWQYRRYQQGDAASAIDWRQSAKRQQFFVRQNEWEAAESVWLWRDGSASMAYRSKLSESEKSERATLLLLALAALLLRGGERVALFGDERPPSSGKATLDRLAAQLLLPKTSGDAAASLPGIADLPRFAQLVLIGDFLSPLAEIEAVVRHYAAAGVNGHLLQVLDPAEEDLPFFGRTRFEGVEGEGTLTIGRVEQLRGDYLARFAAHQDGLKSLCRAAGWTVSSHRTDRPPQNALLALYAALSGGLTW